MKRDQARRSTGMANTMYTNTMYGERDKNELL